MINDADIGWLAGIFDGEGCIALQIMSGGRVSLSLTVLTTSMPLALKLDALLTKLDAKPLSWKIDTVKSRPTRKPFARIRLTDMNKVLKVLTAVRPYLTCKASEADIMIYYISERLKFDKTWSSDDQLKELQIYTERKLKSLKRTTMHVQAAKL